MDAGGNSIYRMSPDWRLMFQLDSQNLASTAAPIEDWVEKYIPGSDQQTVLDAIGMAIRTKSLFELEHRVHLVKQLAEMQCVASCGPAALTIAGIPSAPWAVQLRWQCLLK